MSLMHSGYEDFLMQGNIFKGRMNLGSNSDGCTETGTGVAVREYVIPKIDVDQRPTIFVQKEA